MENNGKGRCDVLNCSVFLLPADQPDISFHLLYIDKSQLTDMIKETMAEGRSWYEAVVQAEIIFMAGQLRCV